MFVVLGQQQEVLDHQAHPRDLRQQQFVDGLHIHRGAGGGGQLQQRGQGGQGTAQLVRGVADERHLRGAGGVEAGEHGVHRLGQASDLVLGLRHRHPLTVPGRGDLGDARSDRLDRAQHAAHRDVDEHRCGQARDRHERQEQDGAGVEQGIVAAGVGADLHHERRPLHVHTGGGDAHRIAVRGPDLVTDHLARGRRGQRGELLQAAHDLTCEDLVVRGDDAHHVHAREWFGDDLERGLRALRRELPGHVDGAVPVHGVDRVVDRRAQHQPRPARRAREHQHDDRGGDHRCRHADRPAARRGQDVVARGHVSIVRAVRTGRGVRLRVVATSP